jgi:catechol 2,3-dioxygenase-like lactoylglutathione lyase family enzyme
MDTDTDHRRTEGELSANIASCVVRVANLARSLQFYRDVFSCHVVSRGADMALLLTPKGFQIYLHEVGGFQRRGAIGIHGVHYVMWATDSQSELTHITERLRAYDTAVYAHNIDGLVIIEGTDPDRCRVIVAYPSPRRHPRTVVAERLRH